jgi:hypothetical protein
MAKTSKSLLADNKILLAAEQKIEGQLTPGVRADYMKVVVAGMHAGLAHGPKSIMAGLRDSKDPDQGLRHGRDQLRGAADEAVAQHHADEGDGAGGGHTLMFLALDSAERMGLIKITNQVVAQATHYYTNHIFKVLNISPQMLHTAAGNLHKITSNPTNMEELRRRAGIVRDPRASLPTETPTEVPEEKTDGV